MKTQIAGRVCPPMVIMLIVTSFSHVTLGQGVEIEQVVPRFLETVEGSVENTGGDPFPNGWRIQFIYSGSEFGDLPDSHRLINEMRWRPDSSTSAPVTSTEPWEIRVSTTQKSPNTISATYDENIDSPQTLVLSGEITQVTTNTGPAEGPREFDIVFPFDTPFRYDPAEGNLLVDIINLGPVDGTDFDLTPDLHAGTNGLGGGVGDPNGFTNPVAPNVFRDQIVPAEFVFIPEPSGLVLSAIAFVAIVLRRRSR